MVGYVYVSNTKGHRGSYQQLFASTFELAPVSGTLTSAVIFKLLRGEKAIFATIGPGSFRQLLLITLRGLIRKHTCAIWLGDPGEDAEGRQGLKRREYLLLRACKRMRSVTILTIFPPRDERDGFALADDWIADPQLWDLVDVDKKRDLRSTALTHQIQKFRSGRAVLAFLGRGSRYKGYGAFVDYIRKRPGEFLGVSVGPIDKDCKVASAELLRAGGIVIDKFASEPEFLSIYKEADYVWCAYSERYDRPSGIFGRAIALGVTPIVRINSFLDWFAEQFELRVCRLEDNAGDGTFPRKRSQVYNGARPVENQDQKVLLHRLRKEALKKISGALGGA